MEEPTPATGIQPFGFRHLFLMLSMAGMLVFFWLMQIQKPTFLGGLAVMFFTYVCIRSWVKMAQGFRRTD